MAFDFRYKADGEEVVDYVDGAASNKRYERGMRLVTVCDQFVGDRLAELCLQPGRSPTDALFSGIHHNTFRTALKDCIVRLDLAASDRSMAKATTSSCRKTWSQWATKVGVAETLAKQQMAQAAGDIHNKHYKFLGAEEAYDIAAAFDSNGAGRALNTVLSKSGSWPQLATVHRIA